MLSNIPPTIEPAYPGVFTPKKKILKAIEDGYFNSENTTIQPKISISETEEYYKVELTAPGIKRENLLVTINDEGKLCILGFKTGRSKNKTQKTTLRMETFFKELSLPEYVDAAFTSATCHAGTLSIFFTKSDRTINNRPSTIVVY